MEKLPVYKGLMENKTAFGIPSQAFSLLAAITIILGIFLKTFLIIIPIVFLIGVLKMVSRKDTKFLSVYLKNLFYSRYYGF